MGDSVAAIKNRIVGHGSKPASQFQAHPNNWRKHPQNQRDAVAASLREVGWVDTVIENVRTGHLVDGHERVWQALKADDAEVPFIQVDLSPEEEALVLATLDPITGMAQADAEKLAELLADVNTGEAALQEMLAKLAEDAGLDYGKELAEDPGAQVDKAAELQVKWQTARGQVWEIGRHRLVCGDCTDPQVVSWLMAGERAHLGVTSPPYAVGKEYEADVSFAEHLELLRGVADRALEVITPGGFFFVNFDEIAAQSHAGKLTGSKRQCLYPISKDYWQIFHVERGMDLYAQRIWYKPFNRLQQPFWTYKTSIPHHQEWEHIWTWRLPGGEGDECHDWDISVHAVWDTRNEATDDKPLTRHTAAFPVCLPERAIKAHSPVGAVVWEPFCGSGTTMVACEKLGRVCRASELEPKYVAVSLERLAGMGLEPRLVE